MKSKRRLEGWLLIDNRASGGTLEERPVITCSHCQQQVAVQPLRVRNIFECPRCDKYLCHRCAELYRKTDECLNFQRTLDLVEKDAFRELTRHVTVDPRVILS
jgi:predicted RNA-binding Zn-ribbon protein involved in translation (DUF1610 family)